MADPPAARDGAMSVVLSTVPSRAAGEELVERLVEERLIACGNLVPGVLSLYRWEGEIAREEEVLVLMKLSSVAVDALFERIATLHPYSVPELVELPVGAVSHAYCRWVIDSTEVSA
jgi:periplasmic divalent cation tolerance protein